MKKILTLCILLSTLLYAQSTDFSIIIKKPFNAALFDITQDYDRSISAVGFSKEFQKSSQKSKTYTNAFEYLASVSNKYGSQMHIVKVDEKAQINFSKTIKLSRFNEALSLLKTPENGYIVGGHTLDGKLLIVKLDSSGKTLYSKFFGTNNYDRLSKLLYMRDGGVVAISSSVTSRSKNDSLFEQGLGNNDIFITRFSEDGKKLWSKKFGTEYDDEGVDAVEAEDGSIMVLAKTSYDKHKNVTIMRLDQNGNKIWLKHFKGETLVLPKKIIRLRDQNFLISLVEYNEMHQEHIHLIKFDLYKNIIIDKTIFTSYPSGLNDIAEFSDSSLIGVGYVKDTHNTDGLAMILDSNLNMLTQEHYGTQNYDNFYALKILHNSQVGVAGLHMDEELQESNMWILKLNRDATMAQTSRASSSFYEQLSTVFKEEIEQKILRIREDLSIEIIGSGLYFELGIYKLTSRQKIFLDKFSKKLFAFLLQNRELIQRLEVNGHTSSEWGTADFTQRYLKNEKLSMERSFSTISYVFASQSLSIQEWLSDLLKGSGLSYSKNVVFDEKEDREKSRRVTFKIILN